MVDSDGKSLYNDAKEPNGRLRNELEEMVGSRMLYSCTDLDIVRDSTAWLAEGLRKSIV